jgi:TetR/AcrR family tetracycline transcriptional repressor
LINRAEAVRTALDLIDADGLEAFSIRRLAAALGVNGSSLYHHFQDKEEILQGVRILVLREGRVGALPTEPYTWQEYLTEAIDRYRTTLLAHPNTAPLMRPSNLRPVGLGMWERMVDKLVDGGVPLDHAYPIIDSAETLAYGSALLNPARLSPQQRTSIRPDDDLPRLASALEATSPSADQLFRLELRALLEGWTRLVDSATAET